MPCHVKQLLPGLNAAVSEDLGQMHANGATGLGVMGDDN